MNITDHNGQKGTARGREGINNTDHNGHKSTTTALQLKRSDQKRAGEYHCTNMYHRNVYAQHTTPKQRSFLRVKRAVGGEIEAQYFVCEKAASPLVLLSNS